MTKKRGEVSLRGTDHDDLRASLRLDGQSPLCDLVPKVCGVSGGPGLLAEQAQVLGPQAKAARLQGATSQGRAAVGGERERSDRSLYSGRQPKQAVAGGQAPACVARSCGRCGREVCDCYDKDM